MNRDMISLLNTIKPGTVQRQRTISITACAYSQVIQCRGWLPPEIGTIAWFSFDNPGQSPRIPIWAGVTELPESFKVGCQKSYRSDSACWWFRRANRLAMIKWGWAREYLERAVMDYEKQLFDEVPLIEQKAVELMQTEMAQRDNGNGDPMNYRDFLTRYTHNFSRATMQKWWELGDFFWAYYARGW